MRQGKQIYARGQGEQCLEWAHSRVYKKLDW